MSDIMWHHEGFTISTDNLKLQLNRIHDYLSNKSYWAENRPFEIVEKSIRNSLCFGVFTCNEQIGFARVVTDYSTFAWLCDVFILEDYRGQGIGKWLVECVVNHPELNRVKCILLASRNAHELYRKYGGFTELSSPQRWMERRRSGPPPPTY